MKILVLSGSRDRQGRTARAIEALCRGVTTAGSSPEVLYLPEMKLERCRQCEPDGWGICRSEQRCVIKDDFPLIVEKIRAAGAVVFANPVYFGDLSESLKGFLDRFRRTGFSRLRVPPPPGREPVPAGPRIPAIGLCYAGGSGNGTTSCAANLEKTLLVCGFDVVDMVLARRQNLDFKIPLLEMTGKWLTTGPTSDSPSAPPPR